MILPAAEGGPRSAHVRGLREGADGGRRQRREREASALEPLALGERGLSLTHGTCRSRALEPRTAGERVRAKAARDRSAARASTKQRRLGASTSEAESASAQLGELLSGEGEPALHVGVERGLGVEVDRDVQERARRGHEHALRAERLHGAT